VDVRSGFGACACAAEASRSAQSVPANAIVRRHCSPHARIVPSKIKAADYGDGEKLRQSKQFFKR
jgi:hypothetical protein